MPLAEVHLLLGRPALARLHEDEAADSIHSFFGILAVQLGGALVAVALRLHPARTNARKVVARHHVLCPLGARRAANNRVSAAATWHKTVARPSSTHAAVRTPAAVAFGENYARSKRQV